MLSGPAVTVGQLLATGLLDGHEVLGGASGLDRPVRMVVPGSGVHEIADLTAGSLVVFGPGQLALDDLSADLAIRLARSSGLAGILADRTARTVPTVTRRLADRLALPLVGVPSIAPTAVVAAFDPFVRTPEIAGLRILGSAAQRFQHPPADGDALTSALADTLGGPVALVDAESRFVAGDRAVHAQLADPDIAEHLARPRPSPGTFRLGGAEVTLLQPVQLALEAPAGYWIATCLRTATGALLEPIRQALAIAALSFAVRVAGTTVELERESRRRSLLLGEILEQPEAPSPRSVERATSLGWRLAGWHTAVLVAIGRAPAGLRTAGLVGELEDQLAGRGVAVSLVERPDGWAFWTTVETATGTDPREMLGAVLDALGAVEAEHDGLMLCAGVGRVHPGTSGIGRSLEEARQACLLARTENRPSAVEHVDAVSTKRLLVGWYGSGPLRAAAGELLAPVLEADPTGELVRTLRRFLDCESSTTDSAHALGVHRNTVMQRMERVTRLLPVDLADPDNRLAVHLAARAVDVVWDEET